MTRYLISFDDGAMNDIPEEDFPDVANASHAVVTQAQDAGVWVYGAGLDSQRASIVATDGTITARTRKPKRSSADSVSSTLPHARKR